MKSVSAPAQTVLATMRVPDQKSKELCCASRLQKCGFSSFPSEAGRNMTLRPVDPFPRLLRRPLGFLFFRMMLWDDSAQDACPTLCRSSSSGGSVGATLKDLKGRLQVEASERWLVPRTPTSAVAPGGMISDFRSDFNVSRTAMPVASESSSSPFRSSWSFSTRRGSVLLMPLLCLACKATISSTESAPDETPELWCFRSTAGSFSSRLEANSTTAVLSVQTFTFLCRCLGPLPDRGCPGGAASLPLAPECADDSASEEQSAGGASSIHPSLADLAARAAGWTFSHASEPEAALLLPSSHSASPAGASGVCSSRPSDDSAATSFWRPHCLGSPPFASLFPQGMVSSRAWMALRRTSTSLCCSSSSSFIPALSSETKLPWTPSSMEYRAPAATLSTLPPLALSSSLAP
mmetsp:Transcript_52067/g.151292  ORF Transcript_52067/g.151292 Transcript_52067/m.151292 type:complete len:407 (-) Transcript_52067:289-1509(-)